MKKLLSISFFCLFAVVLHAQRSTNEQPVGLSLTLQNRVSVQTLPKPDMAGIHAEDEANEAFNTMLNIARSEGRSDADRMQIGCSQYLFALLTAFRLILH